MMSNSATNTQRTASGKRLVGNEEGRKPVFPGGRSGYTCKNRCSLVSGLATSMDPLQERATRQHSCRAVTQARRQPVSPQAFMDWNRYQDENLATLSPRRHWLRCFHLLPCQGIAGTRASGLRPRVFSSLRIGPMAASNDPAASGMRCHNHQYLEWFRLCEERHTDGNGRPSGAV